MGESQCPTCHHVVTGFEQTEFDMKAKIAAETIAVLTDMIDNHGSEMAAWIATCLRGIRQNVKTLNP